MATAQVINILRAKLTPAEKAEKAELKAGKLALKRKEAEKDNSIVSSLSFVDGRLVVIDNKNDYSYCKIPANSKLARVDMDLLHYSMFKYGHNTTPSAEDTTVTVRYGRRMTLRVFNPDADFADEVVLMSILKYIQDQVMFCEGKGIIHHDDGMGGFVVINISNKKLLEICGKKYGSRSKAALKECITRLSKIKVYLDVYDEPEDFRLDSDGNKVFFIKNEFGKIRESRCFGLIDKYVVSHQMGPDANCKLRIDCDFLRMCYQRKHSLIVQYKDLQGLNQAEQGLMIYASGQSRAYLPLARIQKFFRIIEPRYPTVKNDGDRKKIWDKYQEDMKEYRECVYNFREKIAGAVKTLKAKGLIVYTPHLQKGKKKEIRGYSVNIIPVTANPSDERVQQIEHSQREYDIPDHDTDGHSEMLF